MLVTSRRYSNWRHVEAKYWLNKRSVLKYHRPGCNAMPIANNTTFRRNIRLPSSRLKSKPSKKSRRTRRQTQFQLIYCSAYSSTPMTELTFLRKVRLSKLHGIRTQKTVLLTDTAVRSWNLTNLYYSFGVQYMNSLFEITAFWKWNRSSFRHVVIFQITTRWIKSRNPLIPNVRAL
jgi:hypothetical protein